MYWLAKHSLISLVFKVMSHSHGHFVLLLWKAKLSKYTHLPHMENKCFTRVLHDKRTQA